MLHGTCMVDGCPAALYFPYLLQIWPLKTSFLFPVIIFLSIVLETETLVLF
jgi:hypothetical protein